MVLTRAFYWQQLKDDGMVDSGSEIAPRESLHHSTVDELLRLTLLEPAIIQSILAGQQPRCMSLPWFQRNLLPTDWVAQCDVAPLARYRAHQRRIGNARQPALPAMVGATVGVDDRPPIRPLSLSLYKLRQSGVTR